MSLMILKGILELGGIFAVLSFGLYMSYNILNIPDLTIDGSFVLGSAISSLLTIYSKPYLGIIFSFIGGMLAGLITGLLITKLKMMPLLAGILTMTGLYSINLRIMNEKPNISLFEYQTIFVHEQTKIIVIYIIVFIVCLSIYFFLKTHLGLALRACGDNEEMVRASSIDTNQIKIIGLSIANGFVSLSGGLYAQYQSFADIQSGTGMMVIALASLIVGMSIIRKEKLIYQLIAVLFGSIFYRFLLTCALMIGLPSADLKLLSSLLVIFSLSLSHMTKRRTKKCLL